MRTRTTRRLAAKRAGKKFDHLPGSRQPFKHAIELHKNFIDTLAKLHGALPMDRQIAVNELPPYEPRGHGGKHRPTQRVIGGQWSRDRSKYMPAQSGREMERRRVGGFASTGRYASVLHNTVDFGRPIKPHRPSQEAFL